MMGASPGRAEYPTQWALISPIRFSSTYEQAPSHRDVINPGFARVPQNSTTGEPETGSC